MEVPGMDDKEVSGIKYRSGVLVLVGDFSAGDNDEFREFMPVHRHGFVTVAFHDRYGYGEIFMPEEICIFEVLFFLEVHAGSISKFYKKKNRFYIEKHRMVW